MRSVYIFMLVVCLLVVSGPASARDINVKYRDDPVDVSNGAFTEFNLTPSSLVKEMFYDESNQYLLIRLKNTFYHYCNIPSSVVRDWVNASSLGSYYGNFVKGNYSCQYVEVPAY